MLAASFDGVLLVGAIAAWLAAAIAALVGGPTPADRAPRHGALARALGLSGGLLAVAAALRVLLGADPLPLGWWPGFPTQPFPLGPDRLAAPFLLLLGLVAGVSMAAHTPTGPGAPVRLALHAGFALALLLAVVARHGLMFLLAWEGMTLLAAALVASDPGSARARRAAYVFLALSHAGTALLAGALMALGARGGWTFESMSIAFASLPMSEAHLLAWCLTVGFAVKLGLVPLQGWLPLAHPEAPAPVSAVLSSAMVSAGLYGMLRFVWQIPGTPPAGWGTVLLVTGVVTALVGALYAAMDSDAKRLLAWSTVKHSGLLAMALGSAALLHVGAQPALARIALAAALVHALGHGLAKSAAFLAVGELAHAAGTRDLEQWGGLAQRMPRAGLATMIAMGALAGLPVLSCFAGEWLLLQALLHGYSAGAGPLRLLGPFAVAGLALATALALAACAKLIGVGLLGRPRSARADAARESAMPVAIALLVAAALVGIAGLGAPQMLALLERSLSSLLPAAPADGLTAQAGIALALSRASASPLMTAALVSLFGVVGVLLTSGGRTRSAARIAPSWTCGAPPAPRTQYSAHAFARPLRLLFAPVLRPSEDTTTLRQGTRYAPREVQVRGGEVRMLERPLLAPLVQGVLFVSERARRLQAGQLHVYLAYLLITLVVLLVWGRG